MVLISIIALPLLGALVNGVIGVRLFGRRVAAAVACAAMGGSFALSAWSAIGLLRLPEDARSLTVVLATWIPPIPLATNTGIGYFSVDWAFRLDPLAAVMILVVTGIGF